MKFKKLLLSIFLVIGCSAVATAQETSTKKETVIVDIFTMPTSANSVYRSVVEGIRNQVIGAILKTKKVHVIDVKTEALFQKTEADALSEEALVSALGGQEIRETASKQFGAKFAIQGHIAHIQGVRGVLEDGSVYYGGEISFTMKVINLVDGSLVHSKDYSYSGLSSLTGSTDVAAVNNTSGLLVAAIPAFMDTAFKSQGTILEIMEEKKGMATMVAIDLGTNVGLKKGDKFNVYQIKTTAGRTMRTEIGGLTVDEVGGEDISICKVAKCGEQITKSFENPEIMKLVIESDKKSGFGGVMKGIGKGLLR